MAPNRHQPHLMILPEDRANQEIATGFRLYNHVVDSKVQVLPVAGGWINVRELFLSDHVVAMHQFPERFMVLLIDLDGHRDRRKDLGECIPLSLRERVFILATLTEPERLKADLGSYETIGLLMAKDCKDRTDAVWGHALLIDNAFELNRLRQTVNPFLFR